VTLFDQERIAWGCGIPALIRSERADPSQPLAVYIPGGGHLARIAYGHPGANPDDFLITHLARAGYSTLALSYPTLHAAFDHPLPGLTITEWADCIADITATFICEQHLQNRVIPMGWSLGGRLARDLTLALLQRQISVEIFIGLSATPPLPGFGGLSQSDLQLTAAGLLDGSSADSPIFRSREAGLQVVDRLNGRVVLPRDVYARWYVTDSPINFRGEAERYTDAGLAADIAAAIADQGSFDFRNYPICGSIAGDDVSDARHALAAGLAWQMLTAQSIYFNLVEPALSRGTSRWTELRALMDALGPRLTRHVEGSHFFYLGEVGARATAVCVAELAAEAASLRGELAMLLP
jgi:hypothetical protein